MINVLPSSKILAPSTSVFLFNKNPEFIKLLLKHKNIDVNIKDNNGITPLEVAELVKNDEIVALINNHKLHKALLINNDKIVKNVKKLTKIVFLTLLNIFYYYQTLIH
jgi:ankyrin repeat protein